MPVRPELYRRLTRIFHDVAIRNEGSRMVYTIGRNEYGEQDLLPDPQAVGEYYCVNCPYCGDTRKRLWINHMWGMEVPEFPGRFNLKLAICYNEQCLKDHPERLMALYHDVFDCLDPLNDRLMPGTKTAAHAEFRWPGNMLTLDQLPPNHKANVYLGNRGYSPAELSTLYDVAYCTQCDPDFRICHNRIIIPVIERGIPIGWQARIVGTPQPDELKYYSMRGWHKGQCLYNFDQARKYPMVVVCEGPMDVWRFGPEAVCLFGKDISSRQLTLLSNWKKIVLLLDGDVTEDKGLYRAYQKLRGLAGSKWLHAKLPPGVDDPGAMTREAVRKLVYSEAAKARL